ncbi:dihydrolipoamide acetyltransferase family protein [Georgenia sp. H159]|uniref:dihydrolipoamide acetyltransferase family protein n=1 Tax=Georgenia sp. H159 TaxID=3076115 RepID=UPI002D7A14D9|nr:dihydrolipoamide acetyltransferase family protein [Georgenia sp. H159]
MTTFRLPDLGEGLTESEIITWHVAEGEEVELNQILAEVETAKAVVDLPSPYAGRILELHAQEGDVVPVGAPLVEFDVVAGSADSPAAPAPAEAPSSSTREPAAAPDHAKAASSSTPEPTAAPAPAAAPSSSAPEPTAAPAPAAAPSSSTTAETPTQRHAVLVGYGPQAAGDARPRRRARAFATVPYRRHGTTGPGETTPRAMPPVRMLARHLGVDLSTVPGSGPDGLIRRTDVEAVAGGTSAARETGPDRGSTYVPLTGLRKHTARAMTDSAFTAPHAAVFSTVDVTETLALARRAATAATAPTFLSLACRAVVLAARRTPQANARLDADEGRIELFGHLHLGVAVATDRGLVVATVPDADTLDAGTLAEQIADRAARAREGTLAPTELSGSTLTVTNVGVFGVDGGVPILNPGQSVIVALGTVRTRPWEHRGEVALREVVTVTVSFDHRVLDGAEAAAFLSDVTDVLSDPAIALVR